MLILAYTLILVGRINLETESHKNRRGTAGSTSYFQEVVSRRKPYNPKEKTPRPLSFTPHLARDGEASLTIENRRNETTKVLSMPIEFADLISVQPRCTLRQQASYGHREHSPHGHHTTRPAAMLCLAPFLLSIATKRAVGNHHTREAQEVTVIEGGLYGKNR